MGITGYADDIKYAGKKNMKGMLYTGNVRNIYMPCDT